MIVFLILSLVFICLRFYCKGLKQARSFIDDYVLIVSWVLMVVQASIILWTTNYGLGRRPSDLKGVNVLPLIKLTPHALFLALIAAGLSKLSFFITLIRVAPKRWQKIALWVVAIHSTILVAGGSIIGYVDCNFYRRPDRQHPDHCLSERTSKILALTVLMHGAIVEFFLSFVPTMLLWNLEMKRREKIGLICAMSMGIISSILAAFKTRDHWEAVFGHSLTGMPDTYILGREALFGITEICMTIIAACIPFLRPLLHKFMYGNRSDMPVALKVFTGNSKDTSSMGHPHTRLRSSCESAQHGPQEDDAVAILAVKSIPENDGQDAESNGSGTIVRKTHVSVQYDARELDEEQGRGRYHVDVFGPGQHRDSRK
ncbi:unnamed protein product [Sordaria macrospora k-hell]|uniref:WGS project CABT00000000 data, contig 2.1 n=2 Tax=Sordaria macrospora TaxID=5147 RepID=F7VJZ3_SORMK|nr:uncharacterized protein SMAC_00036 [Sordaria macrospora k-hell]CCC05820.1 unnamed protein product [Sordaria macrospora k-hell]